MNVRRLGATVLKAAVTLTSIMSPVLAPFGATSFVIITFTLVVEMFGTPGEVQTAFTISLPEGHDWFDARRLSRFGFTTAFLTATRAALLREFLRYHALANSAMTKNITRSMVSIRTVS